MFGLATIVFCLSFVAADVSSSTPAVTCPAVFTNLAVRIVYCSSNNDEEVDCSQPMPTGTTAILICNPGYKARSRDLKTARCSGNGIWTNSQVSCKQDEVLPWNVNIYYKPDSAWEYRCSGTLITATHVITAATCVSYMSNNVIPATEFQLAARKLVENYTTTEPNSQWRNVSTIIRHELYVYGPVLDKAHNIALLVASSSFELNEFVTPASIDWSGQLPAPTESDVLIAAAMKRERHDTTLELLASQDYSIILDRASCIASADPDTRKYITDDTFCARTVSNVTCDDREGSGLMFRHTTPAGTRHYLWGVQNFWLGATLSAGCYTDRLHPSTNITQYIPWIKLHAGVR